MGWKVTATTFNCEYVTDYVTVMVQPDGTAKCSYVSRYSKSNKAKQKMKNCKWPNCPLVAQFRDEALAL
jgi:hypothetical protein